jgi:hypothetical protein
VLEYSYIEPRKYSALRVFLYYLFSLATVGTVAIIASWPFMKLVTARCLSRRVKQSQADFVIVQV